MAYPRPQVSKSSACAECVFDAPLPNSVAVACMNTTAPLDCMAEACNTTDFQYNHTGELLYLGARQDLQMHIVALCI